MSQPHDYTPVDYSGPPERRCRRARPRLEGLEERLLLYATLNAQWHYGAKITYSFVPDGTSIGGTPSTLSQTMNPIGNWQREIREAAAVWQAVANINLVEVSDNGQPMASSGYQQGDPSQGDIRISAIPLSYGTLGAAFSPPPINGGSLAGDFVFNSIMPWNIDAHYDLKTVAIHEFGHALGMDHTDISRAVMYAYYTSIKPSLNTDDVAGIQSLYGARTYDAFNSNGQRNLAYYDAKSLDAWLTSYKQITVVDLNMTDPGQTEWFWVTIPSGANSSFTVTAQSTGLSLMTPQVTVFDASLGYKASANTPNYTFGGAATAAVSGVTTGQGFFIKVSTSGGGSTGKYQLQVNFGSYTLPVMPLPFTAVAGTSNQPGSSMATMTAGGGHGHHGDDGAHELIRFGNLAAWGDALRIEVPAPPKAIAAPPPAFETPRRFDSAASAVYLIAAAAVDPSGSDGRSPFQSTFTTGWGGRESAASAVDDALAHWRTGGMRGTHAAARRRSFRS